MDTGFLRRIFCAASSEHSDPQEGDRLEELYRRIPGTRDALDILDERLNAFGTRTDDICDELYRLTDTHEMQGFINGFRLGMLLSRELQEGWPSFSGSGWGDPTGAAPAAPRMS